LIREAVDDTDETVLPLSGLKSSENCDFPSGISVLLVILSLINYKSYGKITRRTEGNEKEADKNFEGKAR